MMMRWCMAVLAIVAVTAMSCSDDGGPAGGPQVRMEAELSTATARPAFDGRSTGIQSQGETVDSLRVARVRFLIKEVKLHRSDRDTLSGDNKVRTGPLLVTAVSTGATVFLAETVPAGSYDKVKLEFHRFNGSEVSRYLNDPVFGDFAEEDRYSFIFEGVVYRDGVEMPFVYRSTVTANLMMKFDTPLVLSEQAVGTVLLQVDVPFIFATTGKVLDPRDGRNRSHIDNALRHAIKAVRKALR